MLWIFFEKIKKIKKVCKELLLLSNHLLVCKLLCKVFILYSFYLKDEILYSQRGKSRKCFTNYKGILKNISISVDDHKLVQIDPLVYGYILLNLEHSTQQLKVPLYSLFCEVGCMKK